VVGKRRSFEFRVPGFEFRVSAGRGSELKVLDLFFGEFDFGL
jgi:hypothetical protein